MLFQRSLAMPLGTNYCPNIRHPKVVCVAEFGLFISLTEPFLTSFGESPVGVSVVVAMVGANRDAGGYGEVWIGQTTLHASSSRRTGVRCAAVSARKPRRG